MEGIEIKYFGAFSEGDRNISLNLMRGDTVYQIMVDNHFWGQVVRYYNGWKVCFTKKGFALEDEHALLDVIGIEMHDRYEYNVFVPNGMNRED